MLGMEYAQQFVFLHDQKCGWCNGRCSAHSNRLARHASLAKKITGAKHRDYCFSSGSVYHGEFHAALLDVHDTIRGLALRIDRFVSPKFCNLSRHPGGVEKNLRVESADPSIFCEFLWFHIQAETPSNVCVLPAMFTIPRGPPARLYKREQRAPLTVCKMKHEKARKAKVAGSLGGPKSVPPLAPAHLPPGRVASPDS